MKKPKRLFFFRAAALLNMKRMVWDMTHHYARTHVLWKLDDVDWFTIAESVGDQIRDKS